MALFDGMSERQKELPLLRELAVDFDAGQPVLEAGGRFRQVTGLEAVRVWVWRALQGDNTRFRWAAHTGSYGNQLDQLAGRTLAEAELRVPRLVREALLVCPYITQVGEFVFTREEARLKAAFTVWTVYGAMTAESEAAI